MKTSPQIYSQILFRGICSTDRGIQSFVAPLMNPLARGYEELYKTQKRSETLQESKKDEFFGLRDFYRYECSLLSLYSLILCMFFFSRGLLYFGDITYAKNHIFPRASSGDLLLNGKQNKPFVLLSDELTIIP